MIVWQAFLFLHYPHLGLVSKYIFACRFFVRGLFIRIFVAFIYRNHKEHLTEVLTWYLFALIQRYSLCRSIQYKFCLGISLWKRYDMLVVWSQELFYLKNVWISSQIIFYFSFSKFLSLYSLSCVFAIFGSYEHIYCQFYVFWNRNISGVICYGIGIESIVSRKVF